MKPLRLEITGFGPYLDTQVIDFERLGEHGLFLIHGRTGSGKSSILDALCFALYGETTGGERDGQDMVTTLGRESTEDEPAAVATKVLLEFEHLGARYRAVRHPTQEVAKVRGSGTRTRQGEATLENLSTGEVVAAKVRDVTAAVKEMLRCDVDQFRQTVVLPQGDFRRVVTDDGARRAILTRIFRTEKFERLAERLKEYAKGLASEGKAIRAEREALLEELGAANSGEIDALLAAAETESKNAAEQKRVTARAKDLAVKAKAGGDSLEADFVLLESLDERAAKLRAQADEMARLRELVERATKAAALSDSRNHLDQRFSEHERLVAKFGDTAEVAKAARATVVESQAAQERLEQAERDTLNAAQSRHDQLLSQKDRVAGLAGLQESLDATQRQFGNAQGRVAELDAALEALRTRIEELDREAAEKSTLATGLDAAREALDSSTLDLQALDTLDLLHDELQKLDSDIGLAQAEDARHHLEAAVRDNAPGLLAGALVTGEPCPVCGSVHHPVPSSNEDVTALTTAFEAFGKAAARREGLAVQRRRLVSDVTDKLRSRGWSDRPPTRDDVERQKAAAEARVTTTEAARERTVTLAAELKTARADRETKLSERTGAAEAAMDLRSTIERLKTKITTTLEALPEEYRDPSTFEANLEAVGASVRDLKQRFSDVEQAVQEAMHAEVSAAATLRSLEGQVKTASEALEHADGQFTGKLSTSGFTDRADFEAAELEPVVLEEHRTELETYSTAVTKTDVEINALKRKLAGAERPDLVALAVALEEAQQHLDRAEQHAAAVDRRRDDVKRGHERFAALEKRDAELADRRTAAVKLDELANGQLKGRVKVKLETFVLQSIFHEVLEEGNRHLSHMTGGRYTLLLRESTSASDSGLELDARDNAAGTSTRPVATLSGGEGFLASLALALGLSEVAQRRSGGTELGALFIDEGFGSLDSQALDHVVGILRGLQDGHRMVGVISHVEDLKRRIPAQLHVVTGRTGSHVEMRLNE